MSHAIAFHQEDGSVILTCHPSSSRGIQLGEHLRVDPSGRNMLLTVLLTAIRLHGTDEEKAAAAMTCRAMLGCL